MIAEDKIKLPPLDFSYPDEDDLDEDGDPAIKEYDKEYREETIRLFKKFPYIVAWGMYFGSYGYYIRRECEAADKDNAPFNSIHREQKKEGNKWFTFEDIGSEEVKDQVKNYLVDPKIILNF